MIKPRQMLVPSSKYKIKCPNTMTAEFITVHNTYNDASANNEISYMRNNNNQVSYHFAVDDKEVVQGLPLNRNGWHAGDGNGSGNRKSIGIEICYSKSGGTRYVKAEENAVKFIAQLLHERNWGINKVKKHQDWSGKYCPHRILDEKRWNSFLKRIENELNILKGELSVSEAKKLQVQIDDLKKIVARKIDKPSSNQSPGAWAKTSWEKAQKKKDSKGTSILDGTNPTEPLTRQQFAVVLDRLGLLD